MEIYLIRHTSPLTVKGIIYGQTDLPVAATFESEKDDILKNLPADINAIFTSPLIRCSKLAFAISKQYPASSLTADPALMELNFGEWEGRSWKEVAGEACDQWMADFVNQAPPAGESMLQLELRAAVFFKHLLQERYLTAAIVTHAGFIRTTLAHYRDIPLIDSFTIPVQFGEVFKLSVSAW
jgi:alpha-ribazole phosphatase